MRAYSSRFFFSLFLLSMFASSLEAVSVTYGYQGSTFTHAYHGIDPDGCCPMFDTKGFFTGIAVIDITPGRAGSGAAKSWQLAARTVDGYDYTFANNQFVDGPEVHVDNWFIWDEAASITSWAVGAWVEHPYYYVLSSSTGDQVHLDFHDIDGAWTRGRGAWSILAVPEPSTLALLLPLLIPLIASGRRVRRCRQDSAR